RSAGSQEAGSQVDPGPEARRRDPAAASGEPAPRAASSPGRDRDRSPKKSLRASGDPPEHPRDGRERLMLAVEQLAPDVGTSPACLSLGISRASFYRRRHPPELPSTPRATPPRALSAAE